MMIHSVHPDAIPLCANSLTCSAIPQDWPDRQGLKLLPVPVFIESFFPTCRQTGPTVTTVTWIPAFVEVMN